MGGLSTVESVSELTFFSTMRQMKQFRIIFIGLLLVVCVGTLWANDPDGDTYPTAERLFYITRSVNKNLVCYDMNLANGQLDTEKPLHVYWINREEHPGKKDELNFIQRKMAYGYKLVRKDTNQCVVSLTAYPGRELIIRAHGGSYACFVLINGQEAILQSLFVKTKPSNPMSVEYVELRGITTDGNQKVSEQVRK